MERGPGPARRGAAVDTETGCPLEMIRTARSPLDHKDSHVCSVNLAADAVFPCEIERRQTVRRIREDPAEAALARWDA